MKKCIFSFLLLAVAMLFITGCNTISGMGRDVSILGSDVSSGANAVKHHMSGD